MNRRGTFEEFDRVPPELAGRLADLITSADDVKIVETLRQAMDSELTVRAPREKGEANNYLTMPDWRVRVAAAKIMAEIKHGRPRQQIDMKVSASLGGPMTRAQAAQELLQDWEDVKRLGDDYVRTLKQALPAPADAAPAKSADAELVDVDLPDGDSK